MNVRISDLAASPASYDNEVDPHRAGGWGWRPASAAPTALQDEFGNTVRIMPVPDVAVEFEDAANRVIGREVEIIGLFQRRRPRAAAASRAMGWAWPASSSSGVHRAAEERKGDR